MVRVLLGAVVAAAMSVSLQLGAASQTLTQSPSPVAVDVNGPHIIIRGFDAPRDWSGTTVELNSYWTFKVARLPKLKDLCINAAAFTVKESIRAGRDFSGVHYEPTEMKVKTVAIQAGTGTAVPIKSVTSGLIKPLTPQEAAVQCVGKVQ